MKIAIVGLGVAGSYLLNRLAIERCWGNGDMLHVFETRARNDQRHLCGWMTTKKTVKEYAYQTDIGQGEDYIIRNIEKLYLKSGGKEIVIKTRKAVTFNKHQFLIDMQNCVLDHVDNVFFGKRVHRTFGIELKKYDLIIDATGHRRAMLGSIPGARKQTASCRQYTVRFEIPPYDDVFLDLFRTGYLWYTPIGEDIAFVGAGSLDGPHLDRLAAFLKDNDRHEIIEVGQKTINGLPTSECLPFIDGNIVGVGEAIGTTRPFGGEGITPALRSAEILMDCILDDEMEEYEHRIRKEFKSQEREWKYVQARIRGSFWGCLRHGIGIKQPHVKLSPRQKLKFLRSD